jgi:predicted dehydrogenase
VIGVGSLGQHHARILAAMPGVDLVAVADRLPERARDVAQRHGVAACSGPDDLPAGLHAVTIAAPTVDHASLASRCLARGWHVLLEKPMTATLPEAERLVAEAKERGRVLAVGHTERFNPVVRTLLERVRRPRFIEAHRLGVFSARSTDIDVVLDLMIHDLDLVQALVRRPLVSIEAIGVRALTEKIDIANARLSFEGGCVANLTASRISADRVRKLRLFEDDAYVSVDCARQEGWRYRVRSEPGRPPEIIREGLPAEVEEPLAVELRIFAARARGEDAPIVTGEEGLLALRAAHRVLERIREQSALADAGPV